VSNLRAFQLFVSFALLFGLAGCKEAPSTATLAGSSVSGTGSEGTSPVTLNWEAPSESADGTPLTDLAGYKVYESVTPGSYSSVTEVGNEMEHTFDSLAEGTHYFSVSAYDVWGNESDLSDEVSALVVVQ
jgi:hypothetical protein